MQNNTFTLENEYFNLLKLIRKSKQTFTSQCQVRNVVVLGPILDNPLDKFYFTAIFGDSRRYTQIIINFISNGIKFTPSGGSVSVHLIVTGILEKS